MVSKIARTPIAIAASGTDFYFYLLHTGVLTRYLLELPDVNTITFTLSLVDENDKTIWSGAAHAENDTYSVPIDVEIYGKYKVNLHLNNVAGGTGGTAYITFWVR